MDKFQFVRIAQLVDECPALVSEFREFVNDYCPRQVARAKARPISRFERDGYVVTAWEFGFPVLAVSYRGKIPLGRRCVSDLQSACSVAGVHAFRAKEGALFTSYGPYDECAECGREEFLHGCLTHWSKYICQFLARELADVPPELLVGEYSVEWVERSSYATVVAHEEREPLAKYYSTRSLKVF